MTPVTTLLANAKSLLAAGQRARALPLFEQALSQTPTDLGLRQTVAELNAQLGRTQRAVAHYAHACEDYALRGQSLEAIALCKRILALDPAHEETQARLAELYAGRPSATFEVDDDWNEPTDPSVGRLAAPLDAAAFRPPAPPPSPDELAEPDAADLVTEPTLRPQPPAGGLPRIPLFSALSPAEFIAVLRGAVEPKAFDAGEPIVTEGDDGDAMFAIVQGQVSVERERDGRRQVVDEMRDGDVFGEVALLSNTKRTVTVRAKSPTVVLRFERSAMQDVMRRSPTVARAVDEFCRARLLANWLRASPLFRPLNPKERSELRRQLEPRTAKPGEVLVEAGTQGDSVFFLVRGRCTVVGAQGERYPDMTEGDSFGEISVIRKVPATTTVRAVTDCVLLRLPRAGALTSVLQHPKVLPVVERVVAERLQRTAELLGLGEDGTGS